MLRPRGYITNKTKENTSSTQRTIRHRCQQTPDGSFGLTADFWDVTSKRRPEGLWQTAATVCSSQSHAGSTEEVSLRSAVTETGLEHQTRYLCRMKNIILMSSLGRDTYRPRASFCLHRHELLGMSPKPPPKKHSRTAKFIPRKELNTSSRVSFTNHFRSNPVDGYLTWDQNHDAHHLQTLHCWQRPQGAGGISINQRKTIYHETNH